MAKILAKQMAEERTKADANAAYDRARAVRQLKLKQAAA